MGRQNEKDGVPLFVLCDLANQAVVAHTITPQSTQLARQRFSSLIGVREPGKVVFRKPLDAASGVCS